jgi:hypothetical protein
VAGSAQNPLTLNRYLYANANPATLVDPDGHCSLALAGANAQAQAWCKNAIDHGEQDTSPPPSKSVKTTTDGKPMGSATASKSSGSTTPIGVACVGMQVITNYCPGAKGWDLYAMWRLAQAQESAERSYCNATDACFARGADPSLMQDPSKSYLILHGAGECTAFMAAFHCQLPDRLPIPNLTESGAFSDLIDLLAADTELDGPAAEAALMRSIPGEALYDETAAAGLTEANASEGWFVDQDGSTNLQRDFTNHGAGVKAATFVQYSTDAQSLLAEAVESGLPTKVAMTKPAGGFGPSYLKIMVQGEDGSFGTYQLQDGAFKVTSYFMPDNPTYFEQQAGNAVQW